MKMASYRKIDARFFANKWVMKLAENGESQYILLFIYLMTSCENPTGIFEVNPRLWNFVLNPPTPFVDDDVFVKYGKRIRRIDGHPDKGIIVGFCDYQNRFSRNSRQWAWVEKGLQSVGLTYDDLKRMDDEAIQPELDLGQPPPLKRRAVPPAVSEGAEVNRRNIIPPKVEWVREYCSTRNNSVDAQRFMDFYAAKGWKIGKERMKDWEAAVRTWEARRKDEAAPATRTPVKQVAGLARRKF